MCIAYLAIQTDPDWPLFIAANRDEFHARPTKPAAPWSRRADIISGIDLQAKGTWLGITRHGRYAFLTNFREPGSTKVDAPSRGQLASQYLEGQLTPQDYALQIQDTVQDYNGFNLIVGNLDGACYIGNHLPAGQQVRELGAGRYVLSNHLLDTPWPKAKRLRRALDKYPENSIMYSLESVYKILKDGTKAADKDLPATGLSIERERLLSSPFIISPDYGTRSSTIVAVHATGHGILSEITYGPDGQQTERHDWPFVVNIKGRSMEYINAL